MKKLSVLIVVGLMLAVLGSTASASLVARWDFSGNTNDTSGNGNHGTVHGAAALTTDRFGNLYSAYSFDGASGYIDVADALSLNPTDAITITTWFKADPFDPAGTYGWPSLVAKYDDTQGGYDLSVQKIYEGTPQITTSVFVAPFEWITLQESFPTEVVEPNIWYFTAMTYDGLEFTLYRAKEGDATPTPSASMSGSGSLAISNSHLNIGECPYNPGRYWDGVIDDVRIYNQALSSTEIEQIYQVPEPTTILLLGLGGLALLRKRRAY